MGFFRWLNRLAGRADQKLEPTAAAMGAANAPLTAEPEGAIEIEKEEEQDQE